MIKNHSVSVLDIRSFMPDLYFTLVSQAIGGKGNKNIRWYPGRTQFPFSFHYNVNGNSYTHNHGILEDAVKEYNSTQLEEIH